MRLLVLLRPPNANCPLLNNQEGARYSSNFEDLSRQPRAGRLTTTARLNELYADTNQVGFIGRLETDGAPVLEEEFVRVKLA